MRRAPRHPRGGLIDELGGDESRAAAQTFLSGSHPLMHALGVQFRVSAVRVFRYWVSCMHSAGCR